MSLMGDDAKLKQIHVDAIRRAMVNHSRALRSARKHVGLDHAGKLAQGDGIIDQWVKLTRGLLCEPDENGRVQLIVRAVPLGSALVMLDLRLARARVLDFKV